MLTSSGIGFVYGMETVYNAEILRSTSCTCSTTQILPPWLQVHDKHYKFWQLHQNWTLDSCLCLTERLQTHGTHFKHIFCKAEMLNWSTSCALHPQSKEHIQLCKLERAKIVINFGKYRTSIVHSGKTEDHSEFRRAKSIKLHRTKNKL